MAAQVDNTAHLKRLNFKPFPDDWDFFKRVCRDHNKQRGLKGDAKHREGFAALINLARIGQEALRQKKKQPAKPEQGTSFSEPEAAGIAAAVVKAMHRPSEPILDQPA